MADTDKFDESELYLPIKVELNLGNHNDAIAMANAIIYHYVNAETRWRYNAKNQVELVADTLQAWLKMVNGGECDEC